MGTRRVPRWSELSELVRPRKVSGSAVERRLARAATVDDLRETARRTVPRAVFDYTDGAAGEELSLARSREAFRRVEFRPSVLRDVATVDTATTVLGRPAALPLVFAPTGFTRLMHTDGEPAVARVAERTGIPYALSTMGTTSMEALAAAAPGTRRWFQLYLWRDREASAAMVQRARDAGYEALVLTVDTPVAGPRLRDVRNGFTIPPALSLRTVANAALHPRWWIDLLTTEPLEFASLSSWGGTVGELVDRVFEPSATVADVARLREDWPGPLVVKGIQGADDARAVVDAGADAVVVSNHGGRQLDGAIAALDALPAIVDAVGGDLQVLLDSGVRSGADIVKALALGADAVLIGRPFVWGLAAGGEDGALAVLRGMLADLDLTLGLTGHTAPGELNPGILVREGVG